MNILSVIPLDNTAGKEELSYFSSKEVSVGSIVEIPLRKRKVFGVVISSREISDEKTEIKKSSFALKKVTGSFKNTIFTEEFANGIKKASEYFSVPYGSLLKIMIPVALLKSTNRKKIKVSEGTHIPPEQNGMYLIQESDSDRFSHYKSLIREQLARKNSVFFCVPTKEDAVYMHENLSKGIEGYSFLLHGNLTEDAFIKKWNEIIKMEKPVLVVGTPQFICLPRKDFRAIVVERENSRSYTSLRRPYVDFRKTVEFIAKSIGSAFYTGDVVLRAETLWRYDQSEFHEFAPLKFRALSDASCKRVQMNKKEKDVTNQNNFNSQENKEYEWIISSELRELIARARENNEKIFLFAARKGLAPTVVCEDCGTVVVCERCEAPMVLHGKSAREDQNSFMCHRCGMLSHAGVLCKTCKSWRLSPIGIGTEMVKKVVKEIFPEANIFTIDGDVATSAKKARETADSWYESAGGVLIGTEMALLYLHEPVQNVGIVSMDSYFGIPDFRVHERIVTILTRARSIAQKKFIFQTRLEHELINKVLEGNLADFYRDEFLERKRYNYPPWTVLVKFTIMSTPQKIENEIVELKKYLDPYLVLFSPLRIRTKKGTYEASGIIKVPRDKWPDKELSEKILCLPPYIKVWTHADSTL